MCLPQPSRQTRLVHGTERHTQQRRDGDQRSTINPLGTTCSALDPSTHSLSTLLVLSKGPLYPDCVQTVKKRGKGLDTLSGQLNPGKASILRFLLFQDKSSHSETLPLVAGANLAGLQSLSPTKTFSAVTKSYRYM